VSGATSLQTLSTVVGSIGAATQRLWSVRVGRVPSTGPAQDATSRFCALVDDLFYVEFAVDDALRSVDGRVIAWDRDLTDELGGQARVLTDDVTGLVTRIGEVIARATPPRYRDALRQARDGRVRLGSAPVSEVSADVALGRRAARERSGDPLEHVDLDRIAQLAEQQWPGAEATRTDAALTVLPYDTNRALFAMDQHRGVEAGVILHGQVMLGTLLGRSLHTDNDVHSIALTIAVIDDWLLLSQPDDGILARKRLTQ
jgi:hypothetical protein